MNFRQRGRSVQVIRSKSGVEGASGENDMLGTVRLPDYEIDAELNDKLTAEERQELDAYIARERRQATLVADYTVAKFPENLTMISEWMKSAGAHEVDEFLEQIQKPFMKLRKQVAQASAKSVDESAD